MTGLVYLAIFGAVFGTLGIIAGIYLQKHNDNNQH
jgi:ABC-type phosphate transport system permease subunit